MNVVFRRFALWATLTTSILLLCVPGFTQAQESGQSDQSDFDRMRQEQENLFEEFTSRMEREWQAWVLADSLAFANFRTEIDAKWDSYAGSTKKEWVEYDDAKDVRTIVDFEKGEAVVEVLVPVDLSTEEVSLEKLREAVGNLVLDRGKTMDYPVLDEKPLPLGPQPVLKGQIADSQGDVVVAGKEKQFAEKIVSQTRVTRTPVKSDDGVARVKLSVAISLVPRHLRVRAEQYRDLVMTYSARYQLDSRVVLAMIHTESYFNPKAKSHIPAFGLMQLVPKFGGKDAYKLVKGQDQMPSPNYLFDPRNNIELGCAYLHLVLTRYLAPIENDLSRLYCTICAYNTGAGNVSKAFTGKTRVSTAARKINAMAPDAVLAKLKQDLPYDETKDYITKVLERMKYYDEWKN